jgi:hypothetical protein
MTARRFTFTTGSYLDTEDGTTRLQFSEYALNLGRPIVVWIEPDWTDADVAAALRRAADELETQ